MNLTYTDSEREMYNKNFLLSFELLCLIIENFSDNKDYFGDNLPQLIQCSIYIIVNAAKFSEELVIKVTFFLANISSIKIITVNESFKQFFQICSKVIFENKDANFLIRSCFSST